MIAKFFVLVFSLNVLIVFALKSQPQSITWKKILKDKEFTENVFTKGNDEDFIRINFKVNDNGKGIEYYFLSRYNLQLEEATREKIIPAGNPQFLVNVKNNLYLITKTGDKKISTFNCQKFNSTTLKSQGEPIVIGTFDNSIGNILFSPSIEVSVSDDSSQILFSIRYKDGAALNDFSRLYWTSNFYVFTSDMEKIWDKKVDYLYNDINLAETIENPIITNKGDVIQVIRHYAQSIIKKVNTIYCDESEKPAYQIELVTYSKGQTEKLIPVISDGKILGNVFFVGSKENMFSFFSLYGNKEHGKTAGYLLFDMDLATQKIEMKTTGVFPEEIIQEAVENKEGSDKKSDPGLGEDFLLAKSLKRSNASTDYLLEFTSYNTISISSSNYNGHYSRADDYVQNIFGDIIGINISANYQKATFFRLPKMFIIDRVYDAPFSNIFATENNNKLYLFYNDNPDNIDIPLNTKPKKLSKIQKGILAMAEVDEGNNILKRVPILKNEDYFVLPKRCISISPEKVFLSSNSPNVLYFPSNRIWLEGVLSIQ